MFYSRPDIRPFGWDLKELPRANGCYNFDGTRSDGAYFDIRYDDGWLAIKDQTETEIFRKCINPLGWAGEALFPETVCFLLGLTVTGRKIHHRKSDKYNTSVLDWSGDTTYWGSRHKLMNGVEASNFIELAAKEFPDAVLFQCDHQSHRIDFINSMTNDDRHVYMGFDIDKSKIDAASRFSGPADQIAAFTISFSSDTKNFDYLREQIKESKIDGTLPNYTKIVIRADYKADNQRAQTVMQKLTTFLDRYFHRGLNLIDMHSSEIIERDIVDTLDEQSYSAQLKQWCLEKPNRYIEAFRRYNPRQSEQKNLIFCGYCPTH